MCLLFFVVCFDFAFNDFCFLIVLRVLVVIIVLIVLIVFIVFSPLLC